MSPSLTFKGCKIESCEDIPIINDSEIEEKVESFAITLERISDLDKRIILAPAYGEIDIIDKDSAECVFLRSSMPI